MIEILNGNHADCRKFARAIYKIQHGDLGSSITSEYELYSMCILRELIREDVTVVNCVPYDYYGYDCKDDILAKFKTFINQYYPNLDFITCDLNVLMYCNPLLLRDVSTDWKLLMNRFIFEKLESEFGFIEGIFYKHIRISKNLEYKKILLKQGCKIDEYLKNIDETNLPDEKIMNYCVNFGELCAEFLIRVIGREFICTSLKKYEHVLTGKNAYRQNSTNNHDEQKIIYKYRKFYYMDPTDPFEYCGSYVECPSLPDGDCEYTEYIEDESGHFYKVTDDRENRLVLKKYRS